MTLRKKRFAVSDKGGAMAAARYPLQETDAPRWLDSGDEPEEFRRRGNTMWVGSEAALGKLGLVPGQAVEPRDLAMALRGLHRDGSKVREPGSAVAVDAKGRPRLDEHGDKYREAVVNNYEMVFSVPKSVSVIWALAGHELKARIEQAVLEAATGAVEHLVRTRLVIRGKAPETGSGIAAAVALHATSRAADGDEVPMPQLHVHFDLVGVLDEEGELRTPDSGAFYKSSAMRMAGALGRLYVAEAMKGMGFGIEGGTGRGGRYFEALGVAKELIERMSGRAREVEEWAAAGEAKRGGPLSARERARGGEATRQDKVVVDPVRANEVYRTLGAEHGLGAEEIGALMEATYPERDVTELRAELRRTLLERVRAEGPTVSMPAVESVAYEFGTRGLTIAGARSVLREMQAKGELIVVDQWLVTTNEIREREQEVQRTVEAAANTESGSLASEAREAGIAVAERSLGAALAGEQRKAVERLTAGGLWACLTGQAGTGKGPVLEAVAEAHRQAGWGVIATAVDGATTRRLAHQVRGEAVTIQQLLHRLKTGEVTVDANTLIVIEEASKVGLWHWHEIARLQQHTGAKVIPVGDVGQVGAIESPGMLEVMHETEGMKVAKLLDVRRHRDPSDPKKPHPWLGKHLDALYKGDGKRAVEVLRDKGAITLHADRREAMVAMVDSWAERRREHRVDAKDAVLVVHGTNEDVDLVSELAQQRRLEAGELGAQSVRAADRRYGLRVGDVVMMRSTAYQPEPEDPTEPRPPRVENGSTGIVVDVDPEREVVRVEFDEPGGGVREVNVDLGELRERLEDPLREGELVPSLRLAYAGHPFPLQGGTWDYVGALWGHTAQGREETYSAAARARLWLDVHSDRESIGWQFSEDEYFEQLGLGVGRSRNKKASITHKETPDVPIGLAEPKFGAIPTPPMVAADDPSVARQGPRPVEEVREPLIERVGALGGERLALLERRAAELEAEIGALDDVSLTQERAEARDSLEHLDPGAAREADRLERGQAKREAELARLEARAAALEQRAEDEGGMRGRRKRRELREAASAQQGPIERETAKLAKLRERERELWADGAHPDQWLGRHGEDFARGVAAERELMSRSLLRAPGAERDPVGRGPAPELGAEHPGIEF